MIVVVLGGARSGKSELAERWAGQLPTPVTYVATAWASDDDMAVRIERHRARRPAGWATVEVGPGADLAGHLAALDGTALVDSLGPWVAAAPDFAVDAGALVATLLSRRGDAVVVSDEVGLGVHPESAAGVRFRDAVGTLNRAVVDVADRAFLVVAGRAIALPAGDPLALPGDAPAGRPAGPLDGGTDPAGRPWG